MGELYSMGYMKSSEYRGHQEGVVGQSLLSHFNHEAVVDCTKMEIEDSKVEV
jgi:hypothetical protein